MMKAMLLALAFATATLAAPLPSPSIELFIIEPSEVLKLVDTDKGEWLDSDVVLSPKCANQLTTFTKRNVGKAVVFALLRKNPDGTNQSIDLGNCTFVRAPITNGVLHLRTINPHHFDHKIQDQLPLRGSGSVASAM